MGFGNNPRGHKKTVYCPLEKCKYTSRVYVVGVDKEQMKRTTISYHCPKHQVKLVDINTIEK